MYVSSLKLLFLHVVWGFFFHLLQALLTRLRQAGDHILSISELNFLLQHLTPQGEVSCQTLQEAFEGEKSSLVKTANALKALLSQADRVGSGVSTSLLNLFLNFHMRRLDDVR